MRYVGLLLVVTLALGGWSCSSMEVQKQVDVGKQFLTVGADFNKYCVPSNQKISPATCADFKTFAPGFQEAYPNYTPLQKAQLENFKQAADVAKGVK